MVHCLQHVLPNNILFKLIPLTPPDDEAWYQYTRIRLHHLQGATYMYLIIMAQPAFV